MEFNVIVILVDSVQVEQKSVYLILTFHLESSNWWQRAGSVFSYCTV